jgi:hypothetical protein
MSNSDNFEPMADKILDFSIRGDRAPMKWLGYFD